MQVIYVDTLFLLNGTVDYLLLLASAKVAGEPLARYRFAFGAVIGGMYAVLIFIFPFLQQALYKILLAILMICVAFGKSRRIVRQGFIFMALSFAFAGGVLGIALFGGESLSMERGVLYTAMDLKIVLLSAAFCYGLLTVVFRNFGRHTALSNELVSVVLTLQGKKIPVTALVDTGNTLQDPVSGDGVLVVEGDLLRPFFSKKISSEELFRPTEFIANCTEHSSRLRLLPYQAVGVQGLLLALKVDSIVVNGTLCQETLVAMSPTAISDGGSYQALVGARD